MREGTQAGPALRAGIVGGVLAGIAMALVAMIRAASGGMGFTFPMQLVAGAVGGVDVLVGGAGIAITGMLIHLLVAGTAGGIFGLLLGRRLGPAAAMLVGAMFGVGVWAVNTWLVLPWANPVMLDRQMVAPSWWLIYHLVFGAMLFTVPLLVASAEGSARASSGEPAMASA